MAVEVHFARHVPYVLDYKRQYSDRVISCIMWKGLTD